VKNQKWAHIQKLYDFCNCNLRMWFFHFFFSTKYVENFSSENLNASKTFYDWLKYNI